MATTDRRILLSPGEAGELLGISGASVRRLVTAGKLPGSYLPLPGGSELLKIHVRHVRAYADRMGDEAERAMKVSPLTRGDGRAVAGAGRRQKSG